MRNCTNCIHFKACEADMIVLEVCIECVRIALESGNSFPNWRDREAKNGL